MIHGPLVHCLRSPVLSVKSILSARWKGRQYTERGMGETPSLTVSQKASQSSRAAVGSCAAIRMRPAPCGYAARRRRKKIKSFFRRHVRRKNTLRGASVESSAMGGRPRRGAQRNPFGEKGVSLFRQSQRDGGNPIPQYYPISRRSFSRARFSSRETWTWLTERMRAHCCWVSPL